MPPPPTTERPGDDRGLRRHGDLPDWGLWRSSTISCRNFASMIIDLLLLLLRRQPPLSRQYAGFVVHPRDEGDIWRELPILRYLGSSFTRWFGLMYPPHFVADISTGTPAGIFVTTYTTPTMIARFPRWSALLARGAVVLAAKRGASVIGLGALTPTLTRYGLDAQPLLRNAVVTTGHAGTAATIVRQIEAVAEATGRPLGDLRIAVCGAAGSTGSATVRGLVAAHGEALRDLILIDRRIERARKLADEVAAAAPGIGLTVSEDLADLRNADIGVIVTNAPNAIIRPEHVHPNLILLDDSQPRNTDPSLLDAVPGLRIYDVLAEVPGLRVHFDWGLLPDYPAITFTCLAETLALAGSGRSDLATIGHVPGERVLALRDLMIQEGINPAPWTSFYRSVPGPERG